MEEGGKEKERVAREKGFLGLGKGFTRCFCCKEMDGRNLIAGLVLECGSKCDQHLTRFEGLKSSRGGGGGVGDCRACESTVGGFFPGRRYELI